MDAPKLAELRGGALDGFDDGREGVAEDHGAPGAEEVDVAIAVGVEEVGAFGAGDKGWVAANGAEGAHGGVDAAGEEFFGAKLELARASVGAGHVFSIRAGRLPILVERLDFTPRLLIHVVMTAGAVAGSTGALRRRTAAETRVMMRPTGRGSMKV